MKKGISAWAFPNKLTLGEIFKQARENGFEGVELAIAEDGELNLESSISDIKGIKQRACDNGIELYSVATGLFWQYSLTSDDESIRKKAMYCAQKEITAAEALGCNTVLVIPGMVSNDEVSDEKMVPYDKIYERALNAIKELAQFAKNRGVCIGVENVWNNFLTSPFEMRDFIDKAGDNTGAYFDVGNVVINGYPEQWIALLGNRIKKVHFKDFKRSIGTIEGFVDLLEGDVNYKNVMNALRQSGYDDWVTAEVFPYRTHNEVLLLHTSKAMDIILGR